MELNNQRSRSRNQKNGMTQGSVLTPVLFNIYTKNEILHYEMRNFIYTNDLSFTSRHTSFNQVETIVEESIGDIITEQTFCVRIRIRLKLLFSSTQQRAIHQSINPSIHPSIHTCCCLPTPMALASGGESDVPACRPPASFSVHLPAVQSLRRGLSTNPGATMWCVCGCS